MNIFKVESTRTKERAKNKTNQVGGGQRDMFFLSCGVSSETGSKRIEDQRNKATYAATTQPRTEVR